MLLAFTVNKLRQYTVQCTLWCIVVLWFVSSNKRTHAPCSLKLYTTESLVSFIWCQKWDLTPCLHMEIKKFHFVHVYYLHTLEIWEIGCSMIVLWVLINGFTFHTVWNCSSHLITYSTATVLQGLPQSSYRVCICFKNVTL